MPTQTQLEAVRINKVRKAGLDAVDAAVNADLITIEQWEQAVEDVYSFTDTTEFFINSCAHWDLPEKGRALTNYLRQHHPQED